MLQEDLIRIKQNVSNQQQLVSRSLKDLFDGLGQKLSDIESDQSRWETDIQLLKRKLNELQQTNKLLSKHDLDNCNRKIQDLEQHCESDKKQQELTIERLKESATRLGQQNEQNLETAQQKYEQNLARLRDKSKETQMTLETCQNETAENQKELKTVMSQLKTLETTNQNLLAKSQKLDAACSWLSPSLETLDINWQLPVNTAISNMTSQLAMKSSAAAAVNPFAKMHPLNFFALYQLSSGGSAESKGANWKSEFDQRWQDKFKGEANIKLSEYLDFYWQWSTKIETKMITRTLYRTVTLFLYGFVNETLYTQELGSRKNLQFALYEPFTQIFVIPALTDIVAEDQMFPYIRSILVGPKMISEELRKPLLCFFEYFGLDA
jgi:hypothetical protein